MANSSIPKPPDPPAGSNWHWAPHPKNGRWIKVRNK